MEKNAEFIRTKEFNIVFKGYKPEEVDKFLDVLSVEFDRLTKKNNELQENLDRIKFESTSTVKEKDDTERKKLIEEALISAHRTADEIKSTARNEAEEIKTVAQREADEIIKKRKIEVERTIEELESKKSSIEESLILIQGKYNDFKAQIREMTEGLNSTVDEVDSKFEVKTDAGEEIEKEKSTPPKDIKGTKEDSGGETRKEKKAAAEKEVKEQERKTAKEADTESGKSREEKSEKGAAKETESDDASKEAKSTKENVKEDRDKQKAQEEKKDEKSNETVRERKKIDIANPDIIENFFNANND